MTSKAYQATIIVALYLLCGISVVFAQPYMAEGHGQQQPAEAKSTRVLNLRQSASLDSIFPDLAASRVVFVGEQHNNYGHHLAQLDIIKRLHEQDIDIAIGMEMFQRPYQAALNAYLAGDSDTKTLLSDSQWYDRWRHDYRLYQPILEFAREHGIPVVALNMQREITSQVAKVGIDGLSEQDKASLPPVIDRSDKTYEGTLRQIYHQHPHRSGQGFDKFIEVQLLWDETMAQQVVNYLKVNPRKRMVVLAGSGHLMYGAGIPNRVKRDLGERQVIVLPNDDLPVRPGITDYLLFPPDASLPPRGLMGVMMEPAENGVKLAEVLPEGAAAAAGVKKGDLLQKINQVQINGPEDVRLEMLGRQPGEEVSLSLLRKHWLRGSKTYEVVMELGGE